VTYHNSAKYFHALTTSSCDPNNVNDMRNRPAINNFPPTLFAPNRSPIYGEAHFLSLPGRTSVLFASLSPQTLRLVLVTRVCQAADMSTTAIGDERQTTIPADVSEAAGLKAGDRVDWRFEDGEIRGRKLRAPSWTKGQVLRAIEQSPLRFTIGWDQLKQETR
jgi:bifunctional DNA-binding transcriptional regulator/antitoxin component of YhaV-PrlF toxin-antitoxin module